MGNINKGFIYKMNKKLLEFVDKENDLTVDIISNLKMLREKLRS